MSFTYSLLTLWFVIITIATAKARSTIDTKCSVYDGASGTPASRQRTCSVYPPGSPIGCPEDQYCYQWTTHCQGVDSISPEECPGFVGMNLTYRCAFEGAQLYRHKNGTYQYLNGSSVNYGLLLPEHAGLYECRNSTNHTVYTQNITVNEEIRISASDRGCRFFGYSSDDTCCLSNHIWSATSSDAYYSFVVYANPADNVSVTVEQLRWEVEEETRNDVDIGLYTVQDEQNPVLWRVGFRHSPYRVTKEEPKILFRITASNVNFSHSICDRVKFTGLPFKVDFAVNNVSLPLSKTVQEKEEVEFQCTFSYVTDSNSAFLIQLEFSTPVDNDTGIFNRCITTLNVDNYEHYDDNCTLPPMARITKQTIQSDSLTHVVEYTFRISNASVKLSGSTFTCSLLYTFEVLQWKKNATLTVVPASVHSTEHQGTESPPSSSAASIAASLTVICVVVTVVVFVSVGAAVVLLKKRRQYAITPCDQVPLTSTSVHSSRSTLCGSEANTPVIHMNRLPSFEISVSNGAQRNGIVVGDQAPNGGLIDSNYYNLKSSTDDMFVDVGPSIRDYPKTLQLLRDPCQYQSRTVEMYDMSELKEFVVYISYTDQMSEWVRNELKPLIESLHSVIQVDIHENSMIPGFSVSAERQRLILGADKIVIVVSADYSTSEWCGYELEHAVHQKPSLCNGRIIPILTDDMSTPPRIIEGVVCLLRNQTDFQAKLQQAIFKKPMF